MLSTKKGLFIISLDFELLWGVRDKRTIETYGANIRGVQQVIPSLLVLFEKYEVHATFATVGFLFAKNRNELLQYVPSNKPAYTNSNYSPYENNYLDNIGESEMNDIYHYGSSLINKIKKYPNQEIATHTFSHFYCLEGASLNSFEADLIAARNIASSKGVDLKSIVFPRNQYTQAHVDLCSKHGFIAYRGNPESSIYKPRKSDALSLIVRGSRYADSYANLTGHHTYNIEKNKDILNLPASCFLRPYSRKLYLFEKLRMNRIKQGITNAANTQTAFHLWWHPHNFGINLQENLRFLEEILRHFQMLRKKDKIESKSMREIAEENLIYE